MSGIISKWWGRQLFLISDISFSIFSLADLYSDKVSAPERNASFARSRRNLAFEIKSESLFFAVDIFKLALKLPMDLKASYNAGKRADELMEWEILHIPWLYPPHCI